MQTYLFYDIETTGLNKAFDQVLQFAAIRTDLNLNEIDRHEIHVKLNPDVIPSPFALITHHIGIADSAKGIPEFDAIKQIHTLMNTPGTISVGYNTLGFDDEFLRFSFYRNLLSAYTHQFANQCSRMDIYPMTVMYYLFKEDTLKWPMLDDKITLKLEKINIENAFFEGRAHDAMVDVEITLRLARKLFKERTMWNYLTDYFNKTIDEKRSKNLTQNVGLMIDGKIGSSNYFQAPVLFLGLHRHYKNQLWLRLDQEDLTTTTQDTIGETTWVIRKKLAEPGFIVPFEEKYLKHMTEQRQVLYKANLKWLQAQPDLLQKITNYHANFTYPVYPQTDANARLYLDGFWSQDEERFCRQFHSSSPSKKSALTDYLNNSKLKILATRILGRCYPDALSPLQAEEFKEYMNAILENGDIIDYQGRKRLTPAAALNDITEIRKTVELTNTQQQLLIDLEKYLLSKTPLNTESQELSKI